MHVSTGCKLGSSRLQLHYRVSYAHGRRNTMCEQSKATAMSCVSLLLEGRPKSLSTAN